MDKTSGTFNIQGISFDSLATQFGTPLYIYDAQKIVAQIQNLKDAFAGWDLKIKYAAKALTNISVLRLMNKNGIGVDVVSIYEAHIVLKAGFKPAEITFTPSGVDFEEIMEGVALGLNLNLDNLSSLEKFGKKYGSQYPCGLRLNPNILAGGHIKISTGHSQSKFGISVLQLSEILNLVGQYKIKISGLHIHTGSEIKDVDVFMKMADILFGMVKEFSDLKFLDFGGGFKVAYKAGDTITDLLQLGSSLTQRFKDFHQNTGKRLELWIEPGKYLVSDAGFLLVKTNVVKQTPAVTFVGVNSGLNHLIRPMMYDAYHEIINVSNPNGPEKTYTVVGNICETDTFGEDRTLHEVREGDLLVLKNAGAYGYSMSSNYNSRPRPAEVMVIDGQAKLVRERDTMERLLSGQVDIFE